MFSSESVNEGHPDKLSDQVSDAVLDACLQQDPYSKVSRPIARQSTRVCQRRRSPPPRAAPFHTHPLRAPRRLRARRAPRTTW